MSMIVANRGVVRKLRGFSLVETAFSLILVSVVLVAALNTVGYSVMARRTLSDTSRGQLLAQELLTEIIQQAYEEPVDTPAFGRELSESGADRVDYDDVDDYESWNSSPPEFPDGTEIPNLDGWSREVVVVWVDPDDLTTVVVSDSGVKRIDVSVLRNDKLLARAVGLRTRAGDIIVNAPEQ